jgi:hypothetical protein
MTSHILQPPPSPWHWIPHQAQHHTAHAIYDVKRAKGTRSSGGWLICHPPSKYISTTVSPPLMASPTAPHSPPAFTNVPVEGTGMTHGWQETMNSQQQWPTTTAACHIDGPHLHVPHWHPLLCSVNDNHLPHHHPPPLPHIVTPSMPTTCHSAMATLTTHHIHQWLTTSLTTQPTIANNQWGTHNTCHH